MSNFLPSRFDKSARWSRFAHTLLPQHCALCIGPAGAGLLCVACAESLPALPPHCPQCASPSPGGHRCGRCRAHPPGFAATRCALVYAYPVDGLVHALKYGGRAAFAEIFANALAAVRAPAPDCLVPLPLARHRQRERGYNQAGEIARHLGRRLGAPVCMVLDRTRDTAPQAALPWHARAANVRGAFTATRPLTGLHIAIIDDVMTTGATLDAAARAALAAGAVAVEAWVGARTLPPQSHF